MAQDNYYRILLYVGIVLLFASFFTVAWFLGTFRVPWWAYTVLALGTGFDISKLNVDRDQRDRLYARFARR